MNAGEVGSHAVYPRASNVDLRPPDGKELASVSLPDSVRVVGVRAFYRCRGLTSVTLGNGVTSIGALAFEYCSSLASITIPESVMSIDYGAFSGCDALVSVVFEQPNDWYYVYNTSKYLVSFSTASEAANFVRDNMCMGCGINRTGNFESWGVLSD